MAKRTLAPDLSALASDIMETLLAGLHHYRPDLAYPQSHSDMDGMVRALLQDFEVKRRPAFQRLRYEGDPESSPPASAEVVERVARALCAIHYAERFGKPVDDPHVLQNVDGNWRELFEATATIAVQASGAAVQVPDHYGYLYHNPDTGIEWAPNHPVESGEVLDAKDVRPATLAALHAELMQSWELLAEERNNRRQAPARQDDDPLEECAAPQKQGA